MKTLRQVTQVLGATDPVISVRSLANMLQMLPPISLRYLITRGSYKMDQPIRNKWAEFGWEAGSLGYPTTETLTQKDGVVRYNDFEHGSIYWKTDVGAHVVMEPLRGIIAGYCSGTVPITDTKTSPDGRWVWNDFLRFQGNKGFLDGDMWPVPESYYWSLEISGTAPTFHFAWLVGLIQVKYVELGRENGFLGYPIQEPKVDTVTWDNGSYHSSMGSTYIKFQGGIISFYYSWGNEAFKIYVTRGNDPFPPDYYAGRPGQPTKMQLNFALGPAELIHGTLRIINAEWTVTLNWKPSLKAKVPCTFAYNTAMGSWTLPESPPAGADNRVTVELSFLCELAGVIEGIDFAYQRIVGLADPVLVNVGQGKDLKVSWIGNYSLDHNTAILTVGAVLTDIS